MASDGALADLPAVQGHPAHAGLGRERDERGAQGLDLPLPQAVAFLGQHHDAAPFGGLVGQGGELGGVGQVLLTDTPRRG